MNNEEIKQTNIKKFNQKKNRYRTRLGFHQMMNHPALNFIWIIFIPIIYCLIKAYEYYMSEIRLPSLFEGLKPVFGYTLIIALIFITIVLIVAVFQSVGNHYAKDDEADLCLIFGNRRDIKNQPPILVKKKKDKETGVVEREFYTSIPMSDWQEKKQTICDRLDIHLIGDIEYGGKYHNKGNRIYFKSKDGRIQQDMGDMYDDEF